MSDTKAIPRSISNRFLYNLGNQQGILNPIFKAVQNDTELSLQIRDGYIDIYWHGGKLICIRTCCDNFKGKIDEKYGYEGKAEEVIDTAEASKKVVETFPSRKNAMLVKAKTTDERKFQQKLYRANCKGDLVIIDTEVQVPKDVCKALYKLEKGVRYPRFDMVGLIATGNGKYRPALIENKWGTKALYGKVGVEQHAEDMFLFMSSRFWKIYLSELEAQAVQMQRLGLIELDRFFYIDRKERPEIMIILGNSRMEMDELKALTAKIEKSIKKPSEIELTVHALKPADIPDDYVQESLAYAMESLIYCTYNCSIRSP